MGSPVSRFHSYVPPEDGQPAPSQQDEPPRTKKYRETKHQVFTVEITGARAWELLRYLEKQAVSSSQYDDVSTAVKFAELFRDQLRQQGW